LGLDKGPLEARAIETGAIKASLDLPEGGANWSALTTDGRSVAALLDNGQAVVWNPGSKDKKTIKTGLSNVSILAIRADWILCASGNALHSFRIGQDETRTLSLATNIKDIAFSAKDECLALTASNEVARISLSKWEILGTKQMAQKGHRVKLQEDGQTLLVHDPVKSTLTLCDTDGALSKQIRSSTFTPESTFSAKARVFVIATGSDLELYDESGALLKRWPYTRSSRTKCVTSQSFDGKWLAIGLDTGHVRVFDLEGRTESTNQICHRGAIRYGLLVPEAELALTSGMDGQTILWNANNGKPVRSFPIQVEAGSFIKDKHCFAVYQPLSLPRYIISPDQDGVAEIEDKRHALRQPLVPAVVSASLRYGLEQDGSSYFLYDLSDPSRRTRIAGPDNVLSMGAFSPDETCSVIVWSFPVVGQIGVWDISKGTLNKLKPTHKVTPTSRAAVSDQARRIAFVDGMFLQIIDSRANTEIEYRGATRLTGVAITSDGSSIYVGREDGQVLILNAGGTVLNTLQGDSASPITSITVSSDGNQLLTGAENGTVTLWQR